jgi:hypothetical protein
VIIGIGARIELRVTRVELHGAPIGIDLHAK